jgi:hypothetical protein
MGSAVGRAAHWHGQICSLGVSHFHVVPVSDRREHWSISGIDRVDLLRAIRGLPVSVRLRILEFCFSDAISNRSSVSVFSNGP